MSGRNASKAVKNYGGHQITKADISAVTKVLTSDWLTQGPAVSRFEEALAAYCGARYAVAVSHGTDALHLAYLAAGLTEGDEVITTPNTFVATSNMLLAVGATPVFCDIRRDTFNIDETKIEKLITKRTKAIVPVHFAGNPCEMEKILRIAQKHHLMVIEDACHALGAEYQRKKIGSLASDMTIFSFHPVKPITTGEGGAIVTNNSELYNRMKRLRNHGVEKDANGFNVMVELGYNFRMTDLQAALGLSQLRRLDTFIAKRRALASQYHKNLSVRKHLTVPAETPKAKSGWHIYVVTVNDPTKRMALAQYLKQHDIGINFHYPPVYSHPFYRQHGYANIHLAETERYWSSCVTIPLHPGMSERDIMTVAKHVRDFFSV